MFSIFLFLKPKFTFLTFLKCNMSSTISFFKKFSTEVAWNTLVNLLSKKALFKVRAHFLMCTKIIMNAHIYIFRVHHSWWWWWRECTHPICCTLLSKAHLFWKTVYAKFNEITNIWSNFRLWYTKKVEIVCLVIFWTSFFFLLLCNFFQPWPADFFPAAETLRATSKEEMKAAKVEWRRTLKHALHSPIFYRSARHRIICEIKGWGLKWLADEFANVMWTVTHAKSKKRERGLA